jgi:hypothetical protein
MAANKEEIKKIFSKINLDLNIEVITSILLENELLNENDLYIKPIGIFKRGFGNDLEKVEVIESKTKQNPEVFVCTNREGLYDMLPEGLFHTNIRRIHHIDTQESVKELHIHQEEEKSARLFFLPLEQEFYKSRILIENKERSVATGFKDSLIMKMFTDFWDLPTIPESLKINLLYLIPIASHIVGNLELTREVFELVLNEPVEIKEINNVKRVLKNDSVLDGAILNDSFILDEMIDDGMPCLQVTIGPLHQNHSLTDFISGGYIKVLIDLLESFFIPLDVDMEVQIIASKNADNLILTEEDYVGRLSYSSYI